MELGRRIFAIFGEEIEIDLHRAYDDHMSKELELLFVGRNGGPGPFQGAPELGQLQIQFPRGGWNFEECRYCNAVPPHPCLATLLGFTQEPSNTGIHVFRFLWGNRTLDWAMLVYNFLARVALVFCPLTYRMTATSK